MKTTSNGNGTSQGNGTSAQSVSAASKSFLSKSFTSTGSEPLSQLDRDTILRLIAQMRDLLPFLQDLTAEERKSLLGMGDKNRIFARKVLEVIQQNPDFLPRSFDVDKFQQNLATFV